MKFLKDGYKKIPCDVLQWSELHRRLNASLNSGRQGTAYRTWVEEVSKFLSFAEQTIFTGITQKYDGLPVFGSKPIFYRSGFCGFSMNYGEISQPAEGLYFYGGREP